MHNVDHHFYVIVNYSYELCRPNVMVRPVHDFKDDRLRAARVHITVLIDASFCRDEAGLSYSCGNLEHGLTSFVLIFLMSAVRVAGMLNCV